MKDKNKDLEPETRSDVTGQELLPKNVTMDDLRDNWSTCQTEYAKTRRRMQLLDAADRGDIWDYIAKKFPEYQISPDTNHVNYIKENICASVYSVGKSANLIPKRAEDEEITRKINACLDTIWEVLNVAYYQRQAGERAALLNYGVTQVGWNQDVVGGTQGHWYKGDVILKNIDPMSFYRDPYATTLEDAAFCIYTENFHKSTLLANKNYHKRMKTLIKAIDAASTLDEINYKRSIDVPTPTKGYYKLAIHWMKVTSDSGEMQIHEIHTIDNKYVLFVKENIQPKMFPFAELYCNLPVKDPIGISEPAKIFQSSLVVNLLDGLMATHAYKAQRPPRLVSSSSGLNLRNFAKYGNDPDKAFIVHGNANTAVQYVQFPPLPPEIGGLATRLDQNIKNMSGIDDKYTGKDTGSILTTGGIDTMLAQATSRDINKINNYEDYAKQLTRLVLSYLITFGDRREYVVNESESMSQFHSVEVDFPAIDGSIQFMYALNISNELPKNKQRLATAANAIMEKSMQYRDGTTPELMTVEEWLSFQDFPQKDLILERLRIQRNTNETEDITSTLFAFAGLIEQGVPPEQAIEMIVQQKQMEKNPSLQLGNTGLPTQGLAGSPQAKQMG